MFRKPITHPEFLHPDFRHIEFRPFEFRRSEFRQSPGRYFFFHCSRFVALILLLAASDVACAQLSGSVSLVSNYVYRGVSLSNDQPEPQVSLAYDNDGGWFGGLFLSRVALPQSNSQLIGYAGYAQRWHSDMSWEAGVNVATYPQNNGQNYGEAFVGWSTERLNARVYYSPNYLGQSLHSLYSEINANTPLTADIHLIAHVGYLAVRAGDGDSHAGNHRDIRLGLGTSHGDWSFQIAVTSLTRTDWSDYYPRVSQTYGGVANIAYGF